jgi:N-acetyl sugar amidotransferase
VLGKYNLPPKVEFCRKCTMSNQRPRIQFDLEGVCSACNFSKDKISLIDWAGRWGELEALADEVRSSDGSFDVVVPCSGGKDGSFVAHTLKTKLGLNPLCVTWSPIRPTRIGQANLRRFIDSGFSHIMGTPNPEVTRKLTRDSLIELGDPFQPFIYGQTNFPLSVAVTNGIKLVMYGENGEVEYGGDMRSAFSPIKDVKNYDRHYFSGLPVSFWTDLGYSENELAMFQGPENHMLEESQTSVHFMGYYTAWNPQGNYYYAAENCGFEPGEKRSEGTYSRYASLDDKFDGFHYYLSFIKFGIGRATSDTAHEIRDELITREEGVQLVQRYDGEFPGEYLNEFLDYCKISKDEFDEVIDSWRSDHIWKRSGNSTWELRNQVT